MGDGLVDIQQLIENVLSEDPDLFIPVLAGCAIILGGLVIGILRGMTGGVIVALLFGGLMTASPILVGKAGMSDGTTSRASTAAADADATPPVTAAVAQGAAEMALLNAEAITSLTRVVNSMRLALDGLGQVVAPQAGEDGASSEVVTLFSDSLDAAGDQLDEASLSLDQINLLRSRLQSDLNELQSALGGSEDTPAAVDPMDAPGGVSPATGAQN
ncbi:hypothetical protein ATO13_06845 [Stappia sp. 22II-S9-Z10]|nr:hypothetical protein ATO13_06845 [Stappia sp. 22II-S9-Z10]